MRGFSLLEILLIVAILAIFATIAMPILVRARARVDVAAAREAFTASQELARQVSAQYGRLSRLHVDPARNRFWVTADTSSQPGVSVLDTVMPVILVGERFGGVRLATKPRTFCYEHGGLGTARNDCDLPNATVIFKLAGIADTITISRLGRLRH